MKDTKKMSCFRLKPKTQRQLSELATLWGVSKTNVLELIIDMYSKTSIELKVTENETEVL